MAVPPAARGSGRRTCRCRTCSARSSRATWRRARSASRRCWSWAPSCSSSARSRPAPATTSTSSSCRRRWGRAARAVPRLLRPAVRGEGWEKRRAARLRLGEFLPRAGRRSAGTSGAAWCSATTSPTSATRSACWRATRRRRRGVSGDLAGCHARLPGAPRSWSGGSGARPSASTASRARAARGSEEVLIVGEIYVRRDNFSVDEISRTLLAKGSTRR